MSDENKIDENINVDTNISKSLQEEVNKLLSSEETDKYSEEERKEIQEHWEQFSDGYAGKFASNIMGSLESINNLAAMGVYNPIEGQTYMQDVNGTSRIPTQTEITRWLKAPEQFDEQLRQASKYYNDAIMQYKRTTSHFSSILTFRNDVRYMNSPDMGEEDDDKRDKSITRWKSGRKKCLTWFEKLNHHFQFESKVMPKVMEDGGYFAYLQETDDFVDLVEMPTDYCYLTGRWDWGYTYAVDLVFFDRYVGYKEVMPELYRYYEVFMKMREAGLRGAALAPYQYYPVPVDKGYVFAFSMLRAQITPPLQGIFKDAMAILDYKNLLRQKTTLDTWKIIAQIIPKDKENKPVISSQVADKIVQATQAILPKGTFTFSTPMAVEDLSFSNAQNQNNITGLGESLFWRSIGVNGSLMDAGDKSSAALKYSLINDGSFVDHMYRQFENFVNLQFLIKSRKFRFRIKFYGNRYTESDDIDKTLKLVTSANLPVGKLFGMAGYDAHEVDGAIICEDEILDWKARMKPIISGSQMSGDGQDGGDGAPIKNIENLSDAGMETRDNDGNDMGEE